MSSSSSIIAGPGLLIEIQCSQYAVVSRSASVLVLCGVPIGRPRRPMSYLEYCMNVGTRERQALKRHLPSSPLPEPDDMKEAADAGTYVRLWHVSP